MSKATLAVLIASAALAACSSNSRPENPVDYVTYRNEPLVTQRATGQAGRERHDHAEGHRHRRQSVEHE